jgi:hypothetical protein
MTLRDRIYERFNFSVKSAYARYTGQYRPFREGIAALNRSDWDAFNRINLSSAIPEAGPLPISAVVRARNAESCLVLSVASIVHYCSEVILVDHLSTDRTWVMMQELAEKYPGRVKAYQYEKPAARGGVGYIERVRAGEGSLAEYYRFCFSLGTQKYLLKWDTDMLANPAFYRYFKEAVDRDADIAYCDGIDLSGVCSCANEGRMFRRELPWGYQDFAFCEGLVIDGKELTKAALTRYTAPLPIYFHLKQIV